MRGLELALLSIWAAGCADESGSGDDDDDDDDDPRGDCLTDVVPDETSGGCRVRLVSPARCDAIDLSGGRTVDFEWTTDGTTCETPWAFLIYGNPASETNAIGGQFSENIYDGITSKNGIVTIGKADLAQLDSDGMYHWVVVSFFGSHPASNAFFADF